MLDREDHFLIPQRALSEEDFVALLEVVRCVMAASLKLVEAQQELRTVPALSGTVPGTRWSVTKHLENLVDSSDACWGELMQFLRREGGC